jgi:hypothetical protein
MVIDATGFPLKVVLRALGRPSPAEGFIFPDGTLPLAVR